MQISRLFGIVYLLLNRRHVTAKELAERFEVSVRTIYRDIDALSQAGVPVYATQGAGGGIFISDSYVLNKSTLSDAEQSEILMALQSLRATGHTDGDGLLARLGSLFDKDGSDWIQVDFDRWGSGDHDRKMLSTLKDAILGQHLLTFTYYSGGGVRTERTVRPVRLVYKGRAWYVQAYCEDREDYRTFKVVRMHSPRLLPETFDRAALPCPPPLETNDPEPVAKRRVPEVMLKFSQAIAYRVLDEFDPRLIEWLEDGSLLVRAHFPMDDWFVSYLLSFVGGVELISPAEMRAQFADAVRDILQKYET